MIGPRSRYLLVSVVLAIVGVVLLAGWIINRQTSEEFADEMRSVPAAEAQPQPPAAAITAGAGSPVEQSSNDGSAVTENMRVLARSASITPSVSLAQPTRLIIAGQNVEAPVVAVGVDAEGRFAVPADGSVLGWYRWSATPEQPGNAVIAGHVDTRADGPGALFSLDKVRQGDVVSVDLDDGGTRSYEVVSLQSYPKQDLPSDVIFQREGPPALVLVTCGGRFDADKRTYEENIVVIARPFQ